MCFVEYQKEPIDLLLLFFIMKQSPNKWIKHIFLLCSLCADLHEYYTIYLYDFPLSSSEPVTWNLFSGCRNVLISSHGLRRATNVTNAPCDVDTTLLHLLASCI